MSSTQEVFDQYMQHISEGRSTLLGLAAIVVSKTDNELIVYAAKDQELAKGLLIDLGALHLLSGEGEAILDKAIARLRAAFDFLNGRRN